METEPVKVVVRVRPSLDSESSATCLRINTLEQSLSVRDPEKHSYAQTPSRTPARTPRGCRTAPRQPAVVSTGEGRSQRPRPRLSFAPSADARTPRAPKTPRSAASLWTTFTFDKVLDDSTSQEEMYEHVEPYVADSVAGYNCTVFAYGQTGAGKTHTMMGDDSNEGIVPRSVKTIFDEVTSNPGLTYSVKMTYVELYMDKFTDLLDPASDPSKRRRLLPSEQIALQQRDSIKVKHDTKAGKVFLTGSPTLGVPVQSYEEAVLLIKQGQACRSIARTEENSVSSRAHTILTFSIERSAAGSEAVATVGKIHLVDLAGNERLSKSKAEGSVLKETQSINSSLTALGAVLSALSDNHDHRQVPFRNNKLTHLLQDSLGGNSKTLFVANVRPDAASLRDTLLSLKYAQKAKRIQNHATLNMDVEGEMTNLRERLSSVQKTLEETVARNSSLEAAHHELGRKNRGLSMAAARHSEELHQLKEQLQKAQSLAEFRGRNAAEEAYRAASAQLECNFTAKHTLELEQKVAQHWDQIAKLEFQLRKEQRTIEELRDRNAHLEEKVVDLQRKARKADFALSDVLDNREEEAHDLQDRLTNAIQERDEERQQRMMAEEHLSVDQDLHQKEKQALRARISQLEDMVKKAAAGGSPGGEAVEKPKRQRVTAAPKPLRVLQAEREEEEDDFCPSPIQKAVKKQKEKAPKKAMKEKAKPRAKAKSAAVQKQKKTAKTSKKKLRELLEEEQEMEEEAVLQVVEEEAKELFLGNCRVLYGDAKKSKKVHLEVEESFVGGIPGLQLPLQRPPAATAAAEAFLKAEETPVETPVPESIEEDSPEGSVDEEEEERPVSDLSDVSMGEVTESDTSTTRETDTEQEEEEITEQVTPEPKKRAAKGNKRTRKKRSIEEVLSTSSPEANIAGTEEENVPNSPLCKVPSNLDLSKAFVASPANPAPRKKRRLAGRKATSSMMSSPAAESPVALSRPTASRHNALAAAFAPRPRRSLRLR